MKYVKMIKHHVWDYPKAIMFRPFQSYGALKRGYEGHNLIATFFLILSGILSIIEYQYTGYLLNFNSPSKLNSIIILITTIGPILILVIANWSITTLMDGSGKLSEIYKLLCYSLFPFILTRIIAIILSHYIVESEVMFYYVIYGIGIVWMCFLVFVGLAVIHEFEFGKTLMTVILTFAAFIFIIFLLMLFFGLIQRVLGFLISLYSEIRYRFR